MILSRHDGNLHYDVRTGMGGPLKDFDALLAQDRTYGITDPIWAIYFEPGVTMDDLDNTIEKLSTFGVNRYFISYSIYGKSVLK